MYESLRNVLHVSCNKASEATDYANFPNYGTRRFNIIHMSSPITPIHIQIPIYLILFLILSPQLRLALPKHLFPIGLTVKHYTS